MRVTTFAIAALSVALAACDDGYGTGSSGCTPSANQVCMGGTSFNQPALTVAVGTKVYWRNGDGTVHSTTSSTIPGGATAWDKTVAAAARDSVTFTIAGTYQYFCKFHGTANSGMRGSIIVQ